MLTLAHTITDTVISNGLIQALISKQHQLHVTTLKPVRLRNHQTKLNPEPVILHVPGFNEADSYARGNTVYDTDGNTLRVYATKLRNEPALKQVRIIYNGRCIHSGVIIVND